VTGPRGDGERVRAAFGARVSGRVRTSVRPVSAATLTLTDGAGVELASACSGPDGSYCFSELRPGRYLLVVQYAGHQPRAVAVHAVPPDLGHAEPLDVVLEPIVSVRGRVRDADTGLPVVAAVVIAVNRSGQVVASAMSEPDGRYQLKGIGPEAVLTLAVAAAGVDPVARTVELRAAGEHQVDLAVPTVGGLAGTVVADGRPLPGIDLVLYDERGRSVAHSRTGDDGGYRFVGVPAGRYEVRSTTRARTIRS
jgi:hypothetical protein